MGKRTTVDRIEHQITKFYAEFFVNVDNFNYM